MWIVRARASRAINIQNLVERSCDARWACGLASNWECAVRHASAYTHTYVWGYVYAVIAVARRRSTTMIWFGFTARLARVASRIGEHIYTCRCVCVCVWESYMLRFSLWAAQGFRDGQTVQNKTKLGKPYILEPRYRVQSHFPLVLLILLWNVYETGLPETPDCIYIFPY